MPALSPSHADKLLCVIHFFAGRLFTATWLYPTESTAYKGLLENV
jgi:hypothetical protein